MSSINKPDMPSSKPPVLDDNLVRLHAGQYHDPFEYLGIHQNTHEQTLIRLMLPAAEQVEISNLGSMKRVSGTDYFVYVLNNTETVAPHFTYRWLEKGRDVWHQSISPYTFSPQIAEYDIQLFSAGNHHHAYRFLGAHLKNIEGVNGCLFSLWAPNVQRISVIGDFNGWDGRHHPMRSLGSSGVWELFIPDLQADEQYKFEILSEDGSLLVKTDPYAQAMALRPDTTSRIVPDKNYEWQDKSWIEQRRTFDWQHQAISIYELHIGSWKRNNREHGFLNWRNIAEEMIPYIHELGYTHIELLPIAEHPLDQSWGYQVTGFFAPTARFGNPDDFRYFIDQCHQHNIGVFLDWVPAHFPKDAFALARFNGGTLYEHADPRRGEHQDWGTLIFDYGRNEVRNFLITNAVYWIEEFHIDGLRVDAVASMLYLDYSREAGEWVPNAYGGRENLEAIDFLRKMNATVHTLHSGVLTMAEESTAWPMVSRPLELGGLGFSMKWNMGWMNDNLSYIENDPIYRQYHHDKLTFSQMYSYSENFVLPLSHDEVVHEKQSLLNKMPGDLFQKFANLRLFYAWHYAHPGKKLLFMGGEIAQWLEWNDNEQLDWTLLNEENHQGIKHLITDLNALYRNESAMHHWDFSQKGFEWIDCHDSSQSVLSLIRKSSKPEESIICVMNFTPVVRNNYRIGVPSADSYQEILNTDSQYYAGSNCGNAGEIIVDKVPWGEFEQSLQLSLPPLAGLFLKGFTHD